MILGGPKLYRKLGFQFGVLKFPLNCLRKTQISIRIFESPLARHAGCYHPIFEALMLIFEVWGHAPSVLTVSSQYRYYKQDLLIKLWQIISEIRKILFKSTILDFYVPVDLRESPRCGSNSLSSMQCSSALSDPPPPPQQLAKLSLS